MQQQNASFEICVLGSANSDLFLKVKDFPREGETINALDSFIKNGGKGANQAVAAARLGSRTIFAGQMGKDSLADLLINEMKQSQVNLDGLNQIHQIQTGQAIILLNQKGENSIVIIGGANIYYQSQELAENYIKSLESSTLLQLQMEVPQFVNIKSAEYMSKANKFVMFDCGGRAEKIDQALLDYITFLSPNETELERIIDDKVSEASPDFEKDIVELVRTKLLSTHANLYVLLKLGGRGSIMISNKFQIWVHSVTNESMTIICNFCQDKTILNDFKIIDTVGAGDCFTSGFCSSFIKQCSNLKIESPKQLQSLPTENQIQIFRKAMQFASAAAFLCITREGAMPSMPLESEVVDFLNKYF